ncbi:HD domain-containing protein, partial [bacterium]
MTLDQRGVMPKDRPIVGFPAAVAIPQGRMLYELALFARDNEALPLNRTFSAAIERMAVWLRADFVCLHFVNPEELDEAVDIECLRHCAGGLSTDAQAIERTLLRRALEASGPTDTRQRSGVFHRAIAVPLRYGGELYAVINAYYMREDTPPASMALDAVTFLGHYLFAGVKRRVASRDGRDYGTVIALLATLLNTRGNGLGSFTRRTMYLAESLALAAGVGPDELRVVRRAALVHDIGMIVVPEAIVLKAGPLTDDERMTVQRHAAVG